jgi:hypothetical protein
MLALLPVAFSVTSFLIRRLNLHEQGGFHRLATTILLLAAHWLASGASNAFCARWLLAIKNI